MSTDNLRRHNEEVVIARSRPRLGCAWPLLVYCIIAAFLVTVLPFEGLRVALGFMFTLLLMFVLLVLGVDAKVTTFAIASLLLAVLLLLTVIVSITWHNFITPIFLSVYVLCSFSSSAQFFVSCAVACAITITASWVETQATVYEIRPNVIIHRRSFFGFGATDTGRFDAEGLRAVFTKHDIFEYWLLGVGRLELWPGAEKQAFVIEHFPARLVPRINHVLNANEVRIDPDR